MSIFNFFYRLFIHKQVKTVLFLLIMLVGIIGLVIYDKPSIGRAAVQFGTVTPWFSPVYASYNGDDTVNNIGSPGQFSFCAIAYRWENTGGDKDEASCRVTFGGNQWTLNTQTRGDGDVKCQAVCYSATPVPPSTGTIIENATLDRKPWDSPPFTENYTGPNGTFAVSLDLGLPDTAFPNLPSGVWTVNSITPPPGTTLHDINGSPFPPPYNITLPPGGTITVTYNFVTISNPGTLILKAYKDGVLWDAPAFTVSGTSPLGPTFILDFTADTEPVAGIETVLNAPIGTYTINTVLPPNVTPSVTLHDVNGSLLPPSATQSLADGGTIIFAFNFVTTAVPPQPLPTFVISPTYASVQVGGTQSFTAIYDPDGSGPQYPQYVTNSSGWSSTNNSVANVGSTGVATGVSGGSATITAQYSGRTASASLEVTAPVPTLVVTPSSWSLAIGETYPFIATYDPDGSGPQSSQNVTTFASTQWSPSDASKVTVSGGVATRVGHGTASITASYSGLSRSATVLDPARLRVSPSSASLNAGDTVQLSALYDPDGSAGSQPEQDVTSSSDWSSARPTVAGVDNTSSKGLVIAGSTTGTASISALYQGLTDRASIRVTVPQPDLTISVAPSLNSGSLTSGSVATFKGTVKNFGNAVAGGTFKNQFKIDGVPIPTDPTITALAAGVSSPVVSGTWVATAGSHTIQLCADSTSLVTESNEGNNCATGATGNVAAYPPPNITKFTATPNSINKGDPSTLAWTSVNTVSCAASAGVGFSTSGATGGTDEVQPPITTDYTIDCTGLDGTTHMYRAVTVTVVPVTVSIKASPTCINGGGNSKISWSATPATLHCNVSSVPASPLGPTGPGISSISLTGVNVPVNVTAKTTYTIACTTTGGSETKKSVIVDVSGCWGEF